MGRLSNNKRDTSSIQEFKGELHTISGRPGRMRLFQSKSPQTLISPRAARPEPLPPIPRAKLPMLPIKPVAVLPPPPSRPIVRPHLSTCPKCGTGVRRDRLNEHLASRCPAAKVKSAAAPAIRVNSSSPTEARSPSPSGIVESSQRTRADTTPHKCTKCRKNAAPRTGTVCGACRRKARKPGRKKNISNGNPCFTGRRGVGIVQGGLPSLGKR